MARTSPTFDTAPFPIDTGTARFLWDRHHPDQVVLEVNSMPSSGLNLADPTDLEFEYMRWFLAAVRAVFPAGQRFEALHLGAGACAFPAALAAAFPASRHVAVEVDAKLAEVVRQRVALPRAPALRLRVGEAGAVLAGVRPGRFDLIVRDAFAGGATPPHLAGVQTATNAAKALSDAGLYLANCGAGIGLEQAKRETAALLEAFPHVAVISEPAQFRRRRGGNVVLAGRRHPFTAAQETQLVRQLAADGFPARLLDGDDARAWSAGAKPLP